MILSILLIKKAMAKKATYSAKNIEVLEGLEPVRKRPGMYIGSTNEQGLHHLVNEVLDNSIDEVVAGHASEVSFHYKKDGSIKIRDNGRGIPIDFHPKFKNKRALEIVLSTLHAGGKFDNNAYKTSGGLHGVGISVVNALSSSLEVNVFKKSKKYSQFYSKGKSKTRIKITKCKKYMTCSEKLYHGNNKNNSITPKIYKKYLCNTHNYKNTIDKDNNFIVFPNNIFIDIINIPENYLQNTETFNNYLSTYYNKYFHSKVFDYKKFTQFKKTNILIEDYYVDYHASMMNL